MTMPTAFTVSMLAWGMLAFPDGYTKAQQIGPGLGNVRWGSDYLLKTFKPDPTKGNLIVYQVEPCFHSCFLKGSSCTLQVMHTLAAWLGLLALRSSTLQWYRKGINNMLSA